MAGSVDPVEVELARIWELTGLRHHDEALLAVSALAVQRPEHRDVLYLQAVNLRSLDRVPEALAALDRLERHHPRCGRLHEERGQCYLLLRDMHRAFAAFSAGVKINPALPVSLQMLQRLCQAAGDAAGAARAAQQLAMMGQVPPEVVEASSLFWDGYLLPAETIIRAYLGKEVSSTQDPRKVGAMRLLAQIGLQRDALDEVESLLESVLRLAPDFHDSRVDYAKVLLMRRKHLRAREEAEKLLKQDPDNREYIKLLGAACLNMGDEDAVVRVNERLLTGLPPSGSEVANLRLWRGHALKILGRIEEAVADYQAALAAQPDFTAAWFSLANLKTYCFTDEEVARMRALEARPNGASAERSYVCFALGKALEDAGDFAASWQYYARGNELVRTDSKYRPDVGEDNVRLLRQACTAEFFATRVGWGDPDPAPVFIVGLPRSGSTLIEQILASHSLVEGTEELFEIGSYVKELGDGSGASSVEALQRLTAADVRRLGERYLAETRAYRRLGRRFFIDKMPNNFWHIGLIHLVLPNAKIIDARREPMACCFSNMKQLFSATAQEFTYSMDDIARYYRSYLALMRHWKSVLPGRVLTVQHEDVVGDLEGNVRRVLEHCALDFEPACLEFHKTRRSVHSASSEQVRRPISRRSLDQWRNYAPWLGPLREALGGALTDYRS